MHILGKVCLGLVCVLALGAGYVTRGLAIARDKWMTEVGKLTAQRDKNIDDVRTARSRLLAAESELQRRLQLWGRQWTAENFAPFPAQPVIQVPLGRNQGLRTADPNAEGAAPQLLQVFALGAESGSRYLGEFQVTQVDDNNATLQLTRAPYVGELENWPQGGPLRLRGAIPAGDRSTFVDLQSRLAIAYQQVIDETAKLRTQEQHIANSQKHLDLRLAELNGDPTAPEAAESSVKVGLVESLRQVEDERNALLEEVDAFRRQLSDGYFELEQILEGNRQKVDELSQQAPELRADAAGRQRTR
jgi:outer membrane murein-binding lipoprotein Lpp